MDFGQPIYSTYMMKKGDKGLYARWKKRNFRLYADHIAYYHNEAETKYIGTIRLGDVIASHESKKNLGKKKYVFEIVTEKRVFLLEAFFKVDMDKWISKVNELRLKSVNARPMSMRPNLGSTSKLIKFEKDDSWFASMRKETAPSSLQTVDDEEQLDKSFGDRGENMNLKVSHPEEMEESDEVIMNTQIESTASQNQEIDDVRPKSDSEMGDRPLDSSVVDVPLEKYESSAGGNSPPKHASDLVEQNAGNEVNDTTEAKEKSANSDVPEKDSLALDEARVAERFEQHMRESRLSAAQEDINKAQDLNPFGASHDSGDTRKEEGEVTPEQPSKADEDADLNPFGQGDEELENGDAGEDSSSDSDDETVPSYYTDMVIEEPETTDTTESADLNPFSDDDEKVTREDESTNPFSASSTGGDNETTAAGEEKSLNPFAADTKEESLNPFAADEPTVIGSQNTSESVAESPKDEFARKSVDNAASQVQLRDGPGVAVFDTQKKDSESDDSSSLGNPFGSPFVDTSEKESNEIGSTGSKTQGKDTEADDSSSLGNPFGNPFGDANEEEVHSPPTEHEANPFDAEDPVESEPSRHGEEEEKKEDTAFDTYIDDEEEPEGDGIAQEAREIDTWGAYRKAEEEPVEERKDIVKNEKSSLKDEVAENGPKNTGVTPKSMISGSSGKEPSGPSSAVSPSPETPKLPPRRAKKAVSRKELDKMIRSYDKAVGNLSLPSYLEKLVKKVKALIESSKDYELYASQSGSIVLPNELGEKTFSVVVQIIHSLYVGMKKIPFWGRSEFWELLEESKSPLIRGKTRSVLNHEIPSFVSPFYKLRLRTHHFIHLTLQDSDLSEVIKEILNEGGIIEKWTERYSLLRTPQAVKLFVECIEPLSTFRLPVKLLLEEFLVKHYKAGTIPSFNILHEPFELTARLWTSVYRITHINDTKETISNLVKLSLYFSLDAIFALKFKVKKSVWSKSMHFWDFVEAAGSSKDAPPVLRSVVEGINSRQSAAGAEEKFLQFVVTGLKSRILDKLVYSLAVNQSVCGKFYENESFFSNVKVIGVVSGILRELSAFDFSRL